MKTKPIFKTAIICLMLTGTIILNSCKHKIDGQDGLNGFLSLISLQAQNKQADSLLKNFDMPKKTAAVVQLVKLLCNLSGVDKNSKPIFKLALNTTDSELSSFSDSVTMATVSINFSRDSVESKHTKLTLKIRRGDGRHYKIIDVDAAQFSKDYVAYENFVRSQTLTDADIYSPQTLLAFKTAAELKGQYDSIPWFQHVDGKTYFFAVKGALNLDLYGKRDTTATYKMGLIGPDKQVLIPLDYFLIHNIGATFPNLIEVEKEHKRGFYDMAGKIVLPVEYDQIYPISNGKELAVLRKGGDYYWWKKDFTVSDKDADIKIADLLPRIQAFGKSIVFNERLMANVTENNSRIDPSSVFIPPSYLVDWGLMPTVQLFKNPLRKNVEYEGASELYELHFEGKKEEESWLASAFYSIKDNYLGGREGLYEHKNVMVINKKNNRVYGLGISSYLADGEGEGSPLAGRCNISKLRAINDSLYEIVVGISTYRELYDGKIIGGGPEYHYLQIKNDKLEELPVERLFGFTKYVKMDDVYLRGCYEYYSEKNADTYIEKATPEMLKFMKNEIYADYKFAFKDPRWAEIMRQNAQYDKLNFNVDDSLTSIDKYNIAFINKKLQELAPKAKVLAAK